VSRGRPRRQGGALVAVAALLLVAGAAVVLSNPRHRTFYLGFAAPDPPAPGADAVERRRGAPLPRAPFRLPGGFDDPASAPEISPVAAVAPGRHVPQPDASGRIVVPVTDRAPFRLPAEGVPAGWALREFAGRATVELVRADAGFALRLRSVHTSFALHRDVIVDLREFPFLGWTWKVRRLPGAGDVRQRATDDQAAQVYVIFPRWPSPLTASDVIGYVWDSRAPVGTRVVSPTAGNVRIVVVDSGGAGLDAWRRHERNVAEDYAALFGRRPPRVGQVAVMIDTNDTRGDAEVWFGDLVFSRAPSARTETPTSMLR
jgi:hypothetical protein